MGEPSSLTATKPVSGYRSPRAKRSRAYYRALRDLATPAMGRPPLIRVDAADRDPVDAYRRHRNTLTAALNG